MVFIKTALLAMFFVAVVLLAVYKAFEYKDRVGSSMKKSDDGWEKTLNDIVRVTETAHTLNPIVRIYDSIDFHRVDGDLVIISLPRPITPNKKYLIDLDIPDKATLYASSLSDDEVSFLLNNRRDSVYVTNMDDYDSIFACGIYEIEKRVKEIKNDLKSLKNDKIRDSIILDYEDALLTVRSVLGQEVLVEHDVSLDSISLCKEILMSMIGAIEDHKNNEKRLDELMKEQTFESHKELLEFELKFLKRYDDK